MVTTLADLDACDGSRKKRVAARTMSDLHVRDWAEDRERRVMTGPPVPAASSTATSEAPTSMREHLSWMTRLIVMFIQTSLSLETHTQVVTKKKNAS
mmetsp:Transcript_85/g.190  ORF Transcript_85/g.190 Transcript_85/m.190 type:complete len:97 (-) Transcript_85:180-470(-)